MNEDLKNLLLTLDTHLEQMYDCFTQDETNLALFHMGAMQAIVTYYRVLHGINRDSNSADQNCVRGQSVRALDKEAQAPQGTASPCSCGSKVTTVTVSGSGIVMQDSPSQAGRGQSSIFDEMDSR